ncbi:QueT transporter family protein [Halanaerobaculum tunisiense]
MIQTNKLTKMGIIAALYVVITVVFSPISYGPIQVRISEGLTILPFFLGSWAAVALWIGCMIANFIGGLGMIDIVFGSLLTLIAGLLTARSKNIWLAGIPPVIINAFGVALILYYTLEVPYWMTTLYVGAGEAISVYLIGVFLIGKVLNKKILGLES